MPKQSDTAKRLTTERKALATKNRELKRQRKAEQAAPATEQAAPATEPKPKPKRPALPSINHSYGGPSTCDTQRRACFFVTTGRVFANFRERSDSYLHDLRIEYADATFPGAGRDKAVIEIAIYAGLIEQSDNGAVLSFTTRGKLFTDAKRICTLPGSYVTHAGFFEHIKRLENPAS